MRKFSSLLISSALLAASLTTLSAPSAIAETTLATCTDFVTQKTIVLKANQKSCKPLDATAIWHLQPSDNPAHSGAGYATLRSCTSKRTQFDYQLLKSKCAKYQNADDYWHTVTALEIPIITTASARGYDGATFALAATKQNIDAPIAYYLITNIKTGQVNKVSPNNAGELSLSNLSSLTSYTFTIAAVSVDGTSLFSSITPVITTGAVPPPPAPVANVVLSCANGGTCIVGNRGPGGGIVYYVSAAPFTSAGSTCNTACKYLEAAPAGWNNGGVVTNDPNLVWSTNTSDTVNTGQDRTTASTEGIAAMRADEKFNWKIGQGFYNTSVMKVAGATSTAQAAVLAYAGTSVAGQWFIPSMNELNELCKYARGQTTGVLTVACNSSGTLKTGTANDLEGFVGDMYWSSSEINPRWSWYQYFTYPIQGFSGMSRTRYVRPVRAF